MDSWEGDLPDLPPELGGVEGEGFEERRGRGAEGGGGWEGGLVHSTCDAANYAADLVERLGTLSLSLSHTHTHTHLYAHTHTSTHTHTPTHTHTHIRREREREREREIHIYV